MSSPRNGHFVRDDVQARIDSITGQNPEMAAMMMGGGGGPQGGFPMNGMPPMDMNAMAAGMGNPMMLQEMMVNQMALMAQMAGAMGILNPAVMGMNGPPMQPGMGGDMGMMNGMNGGPQQGMDGRGRGRGRGSMRGGGRGRGGHMPGPSPHTPGPDGTTSNFPGLSVPAQHAGPVAAPTPVHAASIPAAPRVTPSTSQNRAGFVAPERPQSPTLCKYSLKCTNPACRYSHPSPVATPESGVVLSNDPCENGKNCKDKDCIKAHVSPAASKATSEFAPCPSNS